MSPTNRIFFNGNTIEQAVMSAARHYGVDPDELAYTPVEKKHGFTRTPRRVVIRIDPDFLTKGSAPVDAAPVVEETPPVAETPATPEPTTPEPEAAEEIEVEAVEESEPVEIAEEPATAEDVEEPAVAEAPEAELAEVVEEEPAPDEADASSDEETAASSNRRGRDRDRGRDRRGGREESGRRGRRGRERRGGGERELRAAKEATRRLLALAGLEMDVETSWEDSRLFIDLSGPDESEVTAEDGEVLLAFEYLLPRMLRGMVDRPVPCRVDCGGYQAEREDHLRAMALEAAEEVRRRNRRSTLEPMSPAERRIVHLTLADESDVVTESDGEGYYKRVSIYPA